MNTITKLITSIALLSFFFAKSQQIDWNRINSNTVFDLISTQTIDPKISSSTVVQMGNGNNAELSLSSKTNIIVQQLGDQNSIYYNNAYTEKETKASVTTQGYNNIVDVTGSNSISDGMKIEVKGDNQAVFVRHY